MKQFIAAATIIAAFAIAPIASSNTKVHCGTNHACIERVAQRSCESRHDGWHCRIYHRWKRKQEIQAHAAAHRRFIASHPAAAPAPVLVTFSSRDLCVANREAGSPGAYTYDTIDWAINTGNGYTGAYQFLDGTWQEAETAMGVAYSTEAWKATPAEQTAVFDFWAARYPGAWPNTGPPCGL